MDPYSDASKAPDLRQLTKTKIMGKLFGKNRDKEREQATPTNEHDVLDFLKGSGDKLHMTGVSPAHQAPPPLTRLDTTKHGDSHTEHQFRSYLVPYVPSKKAPKRNTEGLKVGFTNKWPEIIGFGGEEFEEPTIEISKAKEDARARASQSVQSSPQEPQTIPTFTPHTMMRRVQTGLGSLPDPSPTIDVPQLPQLPSYFINASGGEQPGHFRKITLNSHEAATAELKAEMRASEGKALHAGKTSHPPEDSARGSFESHRSTSSHKSQQSSKTSVQSDFAKLPQPASNRTAHAISRDNSVARSSEPSTPLSSLSAISSVVLENNQALDDFALRVQNSYKLFELSADSIKPLRQTSLDDMVRLASWWFLKGRAGIEAAARSNGNLPTRVNGQNLLKEQGHADLAKSLWLVENIQQKCQDQGGPPVSRITAPAAGLVNSKFGDVLERCQLIQGHLGKISSSMKRNSFLPPLPEDAPLSSGIDNAIWDPPLPIPTDLYPLLSSNAHSDTGVQNNRLDVAVSIPLGDTSSIFNYNRMFVDVYLIGEGFHGQEAPICCVMSISRSCTENQLCFFLTDQRGILDLCIQSDRSKGPTWADVRWQGEIKCIDVKLPRGFAARIQMTTSHYTMLSSLHDHIQRVSSVLYCQKDEETIYDKTLKNFEYYDDDPQTRHPFARGSVGTCHIRLLQKRLTQVTGTGARRLHRGYRIAIMTGTAAKHLNGITYDLPCNFPTRHEFMRGPTGDASMSLIFQEPKCKTRMAMTFASDHDRQKLHHLLIGGVAPDEATLSQAALQSFSVKDMNNQSLNTQLHDFLAWDSIQVFNEGIEGVTQPEGSKVVYSDHLRLLLTSRYGTLTDRINASSGELRFRLPPRSTSEEKLGHEIIIHRTPQQDLTFAVSESHVPRNTHADIASYLSTLAHRQTLRTYSFANLQDLHSFQMAFTGFRVLFDGNATSFAISRRRMVVPVYKKWDSTSTRIQIVQNEKLFQLVAWFEGFSHGECMNFVLKGTDVFEKVGKADKCGLKFVDAKFPIPHGGKSTEESDKPKSWSRGVSLDDPEYPAEHDDILVTFGSEQERDYFADTLPASAKMSSRMGSLKR